MRKRKHTRTVANLRIDSHILTKCLDLLTTASSCRESAPVSLVGMMRTYMEHKRKTGNSPAFAEQIMKTIRHLCLFRGDGVMLTQVDASYCLAFIDYLKEARTRQGNQLAQVTRVAYFRCLNCSLNWAVKRGLIPVNPVMRIDSDMRLKNPDSTREYLAKDEVLRLMSAPCRCPVVRSAYLFSCFCGLRFSDVKALTWENISDDGDRTRLRIVMVKTRKALCLPLSDTARRWLPERGGAEPTAHVFPLPSSVYVNLVLKQWARQNGIEKKMTFHTARHTFATMSLQAGVDLYTVSKLLGHTQVKTTQIYARVIDRKKDEAVDALSDMFR